MAPGFGRLAVSCLHCGAVLTHTEPTSSLHRLLWGTPLRRLIMSLFVTVVSFAMGRMLGVRYMLATIALFGLILILSDVFPRRPVYKLVDSGDARAPHNM